ncbi:MAG: radical SAM protein [Chloroflexota bacterium]
MKPKILSSRPLDRAAHNANGGCDGDCARSISTISLEGSKPPDLQKLPPLYESNCDGCDGGGGISLAGKMLWQTSRHAVSKRLDEHHFVTLTTNAAAPLFVLNTPAREILDFFSQPRDPAEWSRNSSIDYYDAQTAIAQFYEVGLLQDASAQPHITTFHHTASPLEAWLYLTRACNLACAHCFVSKDVRRMSLETGLRAVDRLFELAEAHGHPEVKIKYAGGEPTMNWDLIPALHERAKSRARETGLNLTEVLVTNATLLNRERLQFIKDEGFRLSISLDGFGAGHDRQRPVRNGNPTFERVFQSVLLALEMGLKPYLIITITRLNVDEVPALTAFALEHRLMLNLNFYRPHHPHDTLAADNTALTRSLQDALKVIAANLPDYNFMEGLIDRSNFGAAHQHVCGAGRNYLSIDTDGSVLPCHMLTGYNLPGIPLQMLESPRFDDFPNPPIDRRNGCHTCEWRYWCVGGCPIHAKNITGTSNISSPYCSVYKAIYPELVRLQALQLLQADVNSP